MNKNLAKKNDIFKYLFKAWRSFLKILKNWKFWIFVFLFMGLFGCFFNYQKQFEGNEILDQLYGDKVTNIFGVVFLLIGWSFWEFAIGKRKSRLLALISIIAFSISLALIGNILSFIGIGLAIIIGIVIMILYLKPINFSKIIFFVLKKNPLRKKK